MTGPPFEQLGARSAKPDVGSQALGPSLGADPLEREQTSDLLTKQLGDADRDDLAQSLQTVVLGQGKSNRDGAAKQFFVNRYSVLSRLAQGGMGVIFKVWDGNLRRTLAMKVIRGQEELDVIDVESVDPNRLARFLKEAEIAGQLEHPGIVPIHEVGKDASGRMYFTMRLVEGESLAVVLNRMGAGDAAWPQTRVLSVLAKICETLAFAHSRGVVHRDLKPENIMVGQFGETYVMDWGLAKILSERDGAVSRPAQRDENTPADVAKADEPDSVINDVDSAQLTTYGTVLGTPSYMPPEQAAGHLDELDERSDVYSVGAMLYRILTGQNPYAPPGAGRTGREVLELVKAAPPTDISQIAPLASQELVAICNKAMARERSARYANMRAMADDLQAYLENRVVKAHRTGALVELKKWIVRNRFAAVASLAAVLVAIGGLTAIMVIQSVANSRLKDANNAVAKERDDKEISLKNEKIAHQQAVEQQKKAEGLYLAQQSGEKLTANPGLALLLGLESSRRYPSLLANSALLAALDACREERTLLGHSGPVIAACYSPDGTRILTASHDQTACIWDAATGRRTALLVGHTDWVTQAVFSPNGQRVATASDDGIAAIWDAQSGACLKQIKSHRWRVGAVAFSPDGKQLATGSWDMEARIWDAETGQLLQVLSGHQANVRLVAFSPDGKRLLTGSADKTARLWDVGRGESLAVLEGHEGGLSAASFSPDGRFVLTAAGETSFSGKNVSRPSKDTTVRIWDGRTGELLRRLQGHTAPVYAASFSKDGKRIATGGADRVVRVWDVEGDAEPLKLEGHDGDVRAVVFSPDGRAIAVATRGRVNRLWDARSGLPSASFAGHEDAAEACAFSPDGTRVLTAAHDHTARLWRATGAAPTVTLPAGLSQELTISQDGRRALVRAANDCTVVLCPLPAGPPVVFLKHSQPVIMAASSPDDSTICTVCADGFVRLWSAASGELQVTLPAAAEGSNRAIFSRDGTELIVPGPKSGLITCWNTKNGAAVRRFSIGKSDIQVFAPHGQALVALSSVGSEVQIWDTGAVRPVAQWKETSGRQTAVVFSADGKRIVTWPADATSASLWNADGTLISALANHTGRLHSVTFSTDSNWIATASVDGTACVWDASTGKPVARLGGDEGAILQAELAPGGKRLVTQSQGKMARLWDVESGQCLAVLRHGAPLLGNAKFSADGACLLLQFNGGNELAVWDAEHGKPISIFEDRRGFGGAALTPDGRWVLSIKADGTAKIWPANPPVFAERVAPRGLSADERERHPFGRDDERAAYRRARDTAARLQTLQLLARALAARPVNSEDVRARCHKELRGLLASLDSEPAIEITRKTLADIELIFSEQWSADPAAATMLADKYSDMGDAAGAKRLLAGASKPPKRSNAPLAK